MTTAATPLMPLSKVGEALDLDERHGEMIRNRHHFAKQDTIIVQIKDRYHTEIISRDDAPEAFAAIDAYFARTIDAVAADIRAAGFEPTPVDPAVPEDGEEEDGDESEEGEDDEGEGEI